MLLLAIIQADQPHVDITWAAVAALSVVAATVSGMIYWAICSTIDAKLAAFLKELNGTYVRSALCKVATADIKRELDKHEARIAALEG